MTSITNKEQNLESALHQRVAAHVLPEANQMKGAWNPGDKDVPFWRAVE